MCSGDRIYLILLPIAKSLLDSSDKISTIMRQNCRMKGDNSIPLVSVSTNPEGSDKSRFQKVNFLDPETHFQYVEMGFIGAEHHTWDVNHLACVPNTNEILHFARKPTTMRMLQKIIE